MRLFLRLSHFSLGRYCQKNIVKSVCVCVCVEWGLGRDMKGEWPYRGLSIEGRFNPPAHYGRTLEVIWRAMVTFKLIKFHITSSLVKKKKNSPVFLWKFVQHIRIIHLVRTWNFPKNCHFLSLDSHTYVCVAKGKKWPFFGKFCEPTKWMIPHSLNMNQCKESSPIFFSDIRRIWAN